MTLLTQLGTRECAPPPRRGSIAKALSATPPSKTERLDGSARSRSARAWAARWRGRGIERGSELRCERGSDRLRCSTVALVGRGGRRTLFAGEERHLLAADPHDVARRLRLALALDARAVHEHAVAAAEITDRDVERAFREEQRVAARDQRIVDRELTLGAPPDDELAARELDVMRLITEVGKSHGPSTESSGPRVPSILCWHELLRRPEAAFDLAEERRVSAERGAIGLLDLANDAVQIVDHFARHERARRRVDHAKT